jgi:hypothetical protein
MVGRAPSSRPPHVDINETLRQAFGSRRRSKFNTPVRKADKPTIDGYVFDSQKEADRYLVLRDRAKAGEIMDLEVHPTFKLAIGATPIRIRSERCPQGRQVIYKADFRYLDLRERQWVIEDVKSEPTKTSVYKLKRAIVEATYMVRIREI